MKSTVLVLQRKLSPLPSIQTYITWTLLSGCASVMYPAVTLLSNNAILRVTTYNSRLVTESAKCAVQQLVGRSAAHAPLMR